MFGGMDGNQEHWLFDSKRRQRDVEVDIVINLCWQKKRCLGLNRLYIVLFRFWQNTERNGVRAAVDFVSV